MENRLVKYLAVAALCAASISSFAAEEKPLPDFSKDIRPIVEKHCYECHNEKKHKGDLNLTTFDSLDAMERNRDQMTALKATSMPEARAEELDECGFELALAHLRVPELV